MQRIKFKKLKGKTNPNPNSIFMDIHDKYIVKNNDGSCDIICDSIKEYKEVLRFFRRYILMSIDSNDKKLSIYIPAGYILSITKTLGV